MPVNWKDYPPDWEQIAFKKKESVDWKCENCGKQCRKPNEPFDTHKRTLTVSHKDHNPMNVADENLQAFCAPCHLRYDAKHHAETRRKKRMEEDIKKLCKAVGMSVDIIAKKYNLNQDMILELFMQTMKQIQEKTKE